MASTSEHGDLILEIPLHIDPSALPGEIASAIAASQAPLREAMYLTTANINKIKMELEAAKVAAIGLGGAFDDYIGGAKDFHASIGTSGGLASVAHGRFGVMANSITGASTAMRLLTGESGFLVVELGRMSLYMGRAITSAGGLAIAIKTVAASLLLNPVTAAFVALAAIGAKVYSIWSATSDLIEKTKKSMAEGMKKEADDATAAYKSIAGLRDELSVLMGEGKGLHGFLSPKEARIKALEREIGPGQNTSELARQQVEAEFALSAKKQEAVDAQHMNKRILDEMSFYAKQVELENDADRKAGDARVKAYQNSEDRVHAYRLASERRTLEMANELARRFHEGSKFESDPMRKRILQAQEMFDLESARIRAPMATGGVSSLGPAGSEFRFGPGAMGSTIGVETPQHKTQKEILEEEKKLNEKMKRIVEAIEHEFTTDSMTSVPGWEH